MKPLCPINCLRVGGAHLALLAGFWVGVSPAALLVGLGAFYLRLFAVTAIYHRHLSHGSFTMPRWFRFLMTLLACSAGQQGPVTWVSSHRAHHACADRDGDPHSPVTHSFWHAHLGWLLRREALTCDPRLVEEWRQSAPELLLIERYKALPTLLLFLALAGLGYGLQSTWPELHTSPLQMLYWGGLVSTLAILHSACSVNSLAHRFGHRDPRNPDRSGDLPWLSFYCLGENYHARHHQQPRRLRTGFSDPTALLLEGLARLGLVKEIVR
ncbi:MAG: hypothetical protein RL095_3725 [Verrucomicrobiota bacterium]|jgi:stearoyl-CoA desaturase (delta-9 desaturase)